MYSKMRLPWWLNGKESTCQLEDAGLIPKLGRSLEKEMATCSSILAWEFPWIEEPGGLVRGVAESATHSL